MTAQPTALRVRPPRPRRRRLLVLVFVAVLLLLLLRPPFGVADPVFGRGVGYYVFTVPVMGSAIAFLTTLTTVALLATIVLYVLRGDVVLLQRRVTVEPSARWHVAGLIVLLF